MINDERKTDSTAANSAGPGDDRRKKVVYEIIDLLLSLPEEERPCALRTVCEFFGYSEAAVRIRP